MFLGCQLEVRAGFRAGSSLALFAAGKVRVLTRDRSGTCILCYTALYWGSPHLWQRCPRDSAPPPSRASAFNQDLSNWRLNSITKMDWMFSKAEAFDQDLGWCVDYGVSIEGAFENSGCESTSCGVVHGICWGRGTNRSGVGLVLVIVICLILAVCVPLAVSCCFLAGTFGSCSNVWGNSRDASAPHAKTDERNHKTRC